MEIWETIGSRSLDLVDYFSKPSNLSKSPHQVFLPTGPLHLGCPGGWILLATSVDNSPPLHKTEKHDCNKLPTRQQKPRVIYSILQGRKRDISLLLGPKLGKLIYKNRGSSPYSTCTRT